ncbi:MAG: hypothetical protein Kow0068_23300 [Marinilabiliales bacterium]
MKTISVLLMSLFMLCSFYSCNGQEKKDNSQSIKSKNIEVYYFHYTRRCATCLAVENEAREAIKKFFPEEYKSGSITFTSANLDEKDGEALGKKKGASGQTVLIIKGDKKLDLTNEGFMYARTNPEKYHEKIKEAIEGLL